MELINRSFQYGKVALAVRTQYHQLQFVLKVVAICTDNCMSLVQTVRSLLLPDFLSACPVASICCRSQSSAEQDQSLSGKASNNRIIWGGRKRWAINWRMGNGVPLRHTHGRRSRGRGIHGGQVPPEFGVWGTLVQMSPSDFCRIDTKRSVLWSSKYAKIRFLPWLCPGPRWGSSRRSPRPHSRLETQGTLVTIPHPIRHRPTSYSYCQWPTVNLWSWPLPVHLTVPRGGR